MGWADVDNAVCYTMSFVVIYVFLLAVEFFNGLERYLLKGGERVFTVILFQAISAYQIMAQIAKLLAVRLAQLLFPRQLYFDCCRVFDLVDLRFYVTA